MSREGEGAISSSPAKKPTAWARLETGLPHSLPEIMFVDEDNGWVSTQRNRIGHTTDGGLTWTDPVAVSPVVRRAYGERGDDEVLGVGVGVGDVADSVDGGVAEQASLFALGAHVDLGHRPDLEVA